MTSPATAADVAARWRALTATETTKATTLLNDSWLLIKQKNPTVEARIAAATLDEELVTMVQCAMVIRVLRNPDGKRQEQIEDYSYQRDANDTGDLFITDEELALLAEVTSASDAFTIRPWHDPTVTIGTNPTWDVIP
jgi:hypothetical protein